MRLADNSLDTALGNTDSLALVTAAIATSHELNAAAVVDSASALIPEHASRAASQAICPG